MIKDKNDYAVKSLTITTVLRYEMISTIKKRIIHNLGAIKELLKIPGYENLGAGLYTYALEEYGKILFLKDIKPIPPTNDRIKFKYKPKKNKSDKKSYGFLAHDDKFSRVLKDKNFPNSYKVLSKGDFEPNDYELEDFEVGLIADMEARMALLYADFKDKNSISDPPPVDMDLLEKAVDYFLRL